jgi:nitrile hydratase
LFRADWEKRAFGVNLAMGATGTWSLDASRHARESLPPAEYLSSSYYEIWAKGLEKMVLQTGLVTQEELDAGRSLVPGKPVKGVLTPENVPPTLSVGEPSERPATTSPTRVAVPNAGFNTVLIRLLKCTVQRCTMPVAAWSWFQ